MYELIDYAGLFPPAKLQISPAVENYAKYIRSEDKWMMRQFILLSDQLHEISPQLMSHYTQEYPLRLSLISADISNDMAHVNDFLRTYKDIVFITGYESRIIDIPSLESALQMVTEQNNLHNIDFLSFYELSPCNEWLHKMHDVISKMSKYNSSGDKAVGFKLRCGGVEAGMFPDAHHIAETIIACRNASIPMKFTAGLHHPIRHYNKSVQAKMYGFFNIFIGGMMAYKFNLNKDELVTTLLDENPGNFNFSENALKWKDYSIQNNEIEKYRQEAFISFGSCSFDEPRHDMRELGLL